MNDLREPAAGAWLSLIAVAASAAYAMSAAIGQGPMTRDRSAPDVSYDDLMSGMPPAHHDALVTSPWKLDRLHVTDKSGRTTVLDGFHRLAKAQLQQRATIGALRLSPAHLRTISA